MRMFVLEYGEYSEKSGCSVWRSENKNNYNSTQSRRERRRENSFAEYLKLVFVVVIGNIYL